MNVAILGSTGSIGTNSISVSKQLENVKVIGLTANSNAVALLKQVEETSADIAVLADEESYRKNKDIFLGKNSGKEITLYSGTEGIERLVKDKRVDVVINGLSGFAGLMPTLTALKEGKKVALANKEAIVMGWHLIKKEIQYKGQLIPVDSEHSAVFQLLNGENLHDVSKIILTASGGSVYNRKDLENVTPEECLAHPNWDMGVKITVDSATLMNKGLELIEAHNLFDIPYDKLGVYIHPQSMVHALVEYADGTVTAHISRPDMRIPIQYALTAPDRHSGYSSGLSCGDIKNLEFTEPDRERFPALDLAVDAAKGGVGSLIALCAADEVAIKSFMEGNIPFTGIISVIEQTINSTENAETDTLEQIEKTYNSALRRAFDIADKMR
ncbi:MAG: 1-deoxy-D-xylulose-5-phosphate reductoisomerase [Elusimicrobia bacterium]|jgi:1-deoxy-D-xylulose-5-phosphate reductoisomerase|nr:1-deoxy-D-xylulose-5-phosphate reductoisomerase [Elusimicrobiota bacterium]